MSCDIQGVLGNGGGDAGWFGCSLVIALPNLKLMKRSSQGFPSVMILDQEISPI
jgi:hypothetical protein